MQRVEQKEKQNTCCKYIYIYINIFAIFVGGSWHIQSYVVILMKQYYSTRNTRLAYFKKEKVKMEKEKKQVKGLVFLVGSFFFIRFMQRRRLCINRLRVFCLFLYIVVKACCFYLLNFYLCFTCTCKNCCVKLGRFPNFMSFRQYISYIHMDRI